MRGMIVKINKNHIQLIADQVAKARAGVDQGDDVLDSYQAGGFEALDDLADLFADELAKHNDGFDRARFLRDCGVNDDTRKP